MSSSYDVLDELCDGIQILDADGRYVYVNDALLQQVQLSRAALLGHRISEVYPNLAETPLLAALERCRDSGTAVSLQHDQVTPSGRKGRFRLRVEPIQGDRLFISSCDTAEDAMRSLTDPEPDNELERMVEETALLEQRNRELQQFTAVVSHDLRAPLRTIRSFMDLIQQDYGSRLDKVGQEYLGWVLDGAARMQRVLEALLIHSRIGSTRQPKSLDLNEVVFAVQRDLALQLEEAGATLTVVGLPELDGFEAELGLLFQNLITNALKYGRPGRPVHIEIASVPSNGDAHHIAVTDDGQGIEPKYQGRIFNLFERLHQGEASGLGIGLAHCEKIVALHSGKIWVESTPGQGSTFHFTLGRPMPVQAANYPPRRS